MDTGILIAIIAAIPSIMVAGLLAYREWKSGKNEITKEVITNYEVLDKQQKENIQECRNNLVEATKAMHELENKFTDRVAKLEGVVGEKDKQLENLTRILANRNPELETTLTDIRNFMKNINEITFAKVSKKHE